MHLRILFKYGKIRVLYSNLVIIRRTYHKLFIIIIPFTQWNNVFGKKFLRKEYFANVQKHREIARVSESFRVIHG